MVKLTLIRLAKNFRRSQFVDSLRIHAKGGMGGNGLPAYGGQGGKGGDIYVKATSITDLNEVFYKIPTKRVAGGTGGDSNKRRLIGEQGKCITIEVPKGITVTAASGRFLGELNQMDDRVLVARGGIGGNPNNEFAGQRGEAHIITLDLKVLADIGFVGFPNAGKSTLLRALSRAAPKVASYPFTTIKPEIGIAVYEDLRQISLADLPGLIEGAHMNVGMGHKFLKHVERTKLLLFVVDIHGFRLSHKATYRTAFETVVLLNKELELYKEDLISKPAVLVVNKMDSPLSNNMFERFKQQLKNIKEEIKKIDEEFRPDQLVEFDDIIPISAKKDQGIQHLKNRLREVLDYHWEKNRSHTLKELVLVTEKQHLV